MTSLLVTNCSEYTWAAQVLVSRKKIILYYDIYCIFGGHTTQRSHIIRKIQHAVCATYFALFCLYTLVMTANAVACL